MNALAHPVEKLTLRDLRLYWGLAGSVRRCGDDQPPGPDPEASAVKGWRECGAAALTPGAGRPPGDVAARMRAASLLAGELAERLDADLMIDGPAMLTERERLCTMRHTPAAGRTLRGGGRMLPAADGWVALNLSRGTDLDLVPALTDGEVEPSEVTSAAFDREEDRLGAWSAARPAATIVARAALLDLACSQVAGPSKGGNPKPTAGANHRPGMTAPDNPDRLRGLGCTNRFPGIIRNRGQSEIHALRNATVVDLSLLWAGPLAGALFAEAGADVIRVQSLRRPVPVAAEDRAFDARLNGSKRTVHVDFETPGALQKVLDGADVVITSMRAPALRRLDVRARPDQVWLTITGHGLRGEDAGRIGFGDDCAAAAGLVAWHENTPTFAADAIADPLTGLLTATAGLGMLVTGRGGTVDMSLRDVARWAGSLPGSA